MNRRLMDYEIREVVRNGIKYTYKYYPKTNTSILIKQEKINEQK